MPPQVKDGFIPDVADTSGFIADAGASPDLLQRMAGAIATAEGFHKPGSSTEKQNNPGNIKSGGTIQTFKTPDEGWNALYGQLQGMFSGTSQHYKPSMTLEEVGRIYADKDPNWAKNVAAVLQVPSTTTLGQLMSGMTGSQDGFIPDQPDQTPTPTEAASPTALRTPTGTAPGLPKPPLPPGLQRPSLNVGLTPADSFMWAPPAGPVLQSLLEQYGKSKWLPSPRTLTQMTGGVLAGAATLPAYLTGPEALAVTLPTAGAGYTGAGHLYDIVTSWPFTNQPPIYTPARPQPETSPLEDLVAGALQEVGGPEAVERLAGRVERGIPRAVERSLGPGLTPKEKAAVKGMAGKLAEDFPVALNKQSLYEKSVAINKKFRDSLEQAWGRLSTDRQIPTFEARKALIDERRKLYNADGTLRKGAATLEKHVTELIDYLEEHPTLSPSDIHGNTQLWDQFVNWTRLPTLGTSSEPEREFAYKTAANGLRKTIARTFPEIATLNAKVSPWIDAVKILERETTQDVGTWKRLMEMIPEARGAGYGWVLGSLAGRGEAGATVGAALTGLRQLQQTTAWQTASIPVRRQVVDLLNRGLTEEALSLLTGQAARLPVALRATIPQNRQEALDRFSQTRDKLEQSIPLPK